MTKKTNTTTDNFKLIIRDLKNKIYKPIYFLCGDEPFYIDKISDYIETNVLLPEEKEFNQTILYGQDIDIASLIAACKRFPMMAEFQVVIVKEAQNLEKQIEQLKSYIENPVKSTILVLCYKYKKPDGRSLFTKTLQKSALYFVSEKIKDYQLADWIEDYVKEEKLNINPRNALMLAEYLGNDLQKIANQIHKLKILLPEGSEITAEVIQKNIGISKDYNPFELNNALGEKNILKANRIINYFGANDKSYPIQFLIPVMYGFFSKLLKYHLLKDKTQANIASELGINPFIVKEYVKYAANYSDKKLVKIFSYLQEADLKSKGVNNSGLQNKEILKELIFKILH